MKTLGQELRKIRENKSILLRQVASYLEIDTAMISKIERGGSSGSQKTLLLPHTPIAMLGYVTDMYTSTRTVLATPQLSTKCCI